MHAGREAEAQRLAAHFHRRYYGYLLSIASRHAINKWDAEEALQEALASFVRAFDPDSGAPPLAWLTLTLKRECWRKRRREHLELRAGQETERGGEDMGVVMELIPSRGASLEETTTGNLDAQRRLGALKPDQRTALCLLGAGFSYKEIAARKGWTYTKVNRCIREGRAALRTAA